MILRVVIKNFLSFDDEVQFDMFPNFKKTSLTSHIYEIDKNAAVLKMAAIYGANGAGKSNLLKSIEFLKNLITNKTFLNAERVLKYFYAFKTEIGTDPIELSIEFMSESRTTYLYTVKITKSGISEENLYVSGLGNKNNTHIITRSIDSFNINSNISADLKKVIDTWINNNPFSSLLTINSDIPVLNNKYVFDVYNWFLNDLAVIGIHSFNTNLISLLKENDDMRIFATKLFKSIGIGISDIRVNTENFDEWASTHDTSEMPQKEIANISSGVINEIKDLRNTHDISVENGIRKISEIMFTQFGKNGFSTPMDINAQSDGTVRLLSLVPAIYASVKIGGCTVIDEIDHSIHPQLIRNLIRYFSMADTKGQLIFTTHQTCLLNQDFIRTDEVWMAEKQDGSTKIYSLNDYNIHHTKNIEHGYLEGRYSAIPYFGEFNF